jgi:MFS family permease
MQPTQRTISTPSAAIQPPPRDMRPLLSALWVFAMFNYLYADLMGLMDSTLLAQYLRGQVGSLQITGEFLFAAAVLMEIPIAMTLLSRVLPHRANRWANIVAGVIKTAAVAGTLLIGSATGYYLFFATIEIACTALIVVLAWRWAPRDAPENTRSSADDRGRDVASVASG